MTTLKDVAVVAGVSPSTASAAIRGLDIVADKTAQKVLAAAHRLNYSVNVPARALHTGRSGLFTLMLPDLSSEFYSRFADALADEATKSGYQLTIQLTHYDKEEELEDAHRASVSMTDGAFICATQSMSPEIARATGPNFPVVLIDDVGGSSDANFDFLSTPNTEGMLAVIHHLLETGRRHIGVVGVGAAEIKRTTRSLADGVYSRLSRGMEAVQAMRAFGLDPQPRDLFDCDWGVGPGINVAHAFARRHDDMDALVCLNDQLALGMLRGLHECGIRVPEDVAVTGFDGALAGGYSIPTLTTVSLDYVSMAQSAFSLVTSRLDRLGRGETMRSRSMTAGFKLVTRESTRRQEGRSAS